ncbi:MAG: AAA-like domain-containing protein, partial [Microcoleaceae cyanobacterium]
MEDIIKFIENRLLEKKSQSLSYIQRLLLREILLESKKSYEEIANENNYSESYIKQFVAPKLWSILSETLNEKINKNNCCVLLEQHWKKDLADKKSEKKGNRHKFDLPTMQLSLDSNFYIERHPIEKNCYQHLLQPRALIRIKAPRQMGKSSLLARMMNYAHCQNCATVSLSLNQAETELFLNQRRFLRWLCANAAHQLGLPSKLDEYWSDDLGDLVCCTFYFAEYLLEKIDRPVVLALDEINQLFAYP